MVRAFLFVLVERATVWETRLVFLNVPRAAELLSGLKGASEPIVDTSFDAVPAYSFRDMEADVADADELLLARAYFDGQEYLRCAHVLDSCCRVGLHGELDLTKLSPKALALRCYALFLVRFVLIVLV
jgi:Anaphase promoting complex subunit 8 / Cdc23